MWCICMVVGTAKVIKSNCMIFGEKVDLSALDTNLNLITTFELWWQSLLPYMSYGRQKYTQKVLQQR